MDPVSIIALTQFAIEAIRVLIDTGLKAYTLSQEISDTESQLWSYHMKLAKCNVGLAAWKRIWAGYTDEVYIHFWGEAEFKSIVALLTSMQSKAKEIERMITGKEIEPPRARNLLRKPPSEKRSRSWKPWKKDRESEEETHASPVPRDTNDIPSDDQFVNAWQKVLHEDLASRPAADVVRKPGLMYKIGFSVAESTLIEKRIGQLTEMVGELTHFTDDFFRARRGLRGQYASELTRKDADESERLKKAVDNFNAYTSALHEAYKSLRHDAPWSIELRLPDERGSAVSFDSTSKLNLDFTLCTSGNNNKTGPWRRVRLVYHPDAAKRAHELPSKLVQPDSLFTIARADPLYSLQAPLSRRSRVFRPLLKDGFFDTSASCKAWEEDRARLLLGLTNWTILMWHSPWTALPCSCGIRFLQLGNGPKAPRQYTFAAEEHDDCRKASLTDHKLLLLGMTIAELLTGWSLRLPLRHPPWKPDSMNHLRTNAFEKWEHREYGSDWEECSLERILAEVGDRVGKYKLKEVLTYCFEYSSDFKMVDKSADVLPCLVEKVLLPIQEFHDTIVAHKEETANFAWWQYFIKREDVQWPSERLFEA